MKKLLTILTIFCLVQPNIFTNDNISQLLLTLKFRDLAPNNGNDFPIIKEYDQSKNIYIVNVLPQEELNTCGRHAIKNLIYFMNAIEQKNCEDLKKELLNLYDKQIFQLLNYEFCIFLKLVNIYNDLTFPHKIFRLLSHFDDFLKQNSTVQSLLKIDDTIIQNICPIPFSFDVDNIPVIESFMNDLFNQNNLILRFIEREKSLHSEIKEFYKKYNLDNKLATKNYKFFSSVFPSDDFKKYFEAFKKSNKKTFGLIILIPVEGTLGHWVSIIIKKIKNKSYSFFILDSDQSKLKDRLKNSLDTLFKVVEEIG